MSTLGQCYIDTVVEGDDRGDAGINRTAGGMLAALQAFVVDPRVFSATDVNAYWGIDGVPAEPLRAKRRRPGLGPADDQGEDERPPKDQPQLIPAWRGGIDPDCKAFAAGDAVMPPPLSLLSGASLYPLILPVHCHLYHLYHFIHPLQSSHRAPPPKRESGPSRDDNPRFI